MIKLFKKLFSISSKPVKPFPTIDDSAEPSITNHTSLSLGVKKLWLRAEVAGRNGNFQEAYHLASSALDLVPDNPELLMQLGVLAFRLGQTEEAVDYLLTAIHLRENFAEALYELGQIYRKLNKLTAAMEYFEQAIVCQPDNPKFICDLGLTKIEMGDATAAIQLYERAIAVEPDYAIAYNNLGHALMQQKRHKAALKPALIAHTLAPNLVEPLVNLCQIYHTLGDIPAAHRSAKQILRLHPDNHSAWVFIFWYYALYGKFDKAWPLYHYRFSPTGGAEVQRRDFHLPDWQDEPLVKKSILVIAEQGLGDQIMFLSCLPELSVMAERVAVECAHKLHGIFQNAFPDVLFLPTQNKTEDSVTEITEIKPDYQIHMGNLPIRFRPTYSSFDQAAVYPYLFARPEKTTYWKTRLAALPNAINIGISWRGGVEQTRSYLRTVDLDNWLPILRLPNINFINLQYGDCQSELDDCQALSNITVQHWPEAIADYQETAALLCNLDLVISVCTSLIHLAGALAVPTWVLTPSAPEWRYLAHGERIPWYPSVRLCRQAVGEEWSAVIARVQADLVQKLNPLAGDKQSAA